MKKYEKVYFGGGCFWCTEVIFQQIDNVEKVTSGYMGGHLKNPTYQDISKGTSGHAEVVELEYDPIKISFQSLLDVFWKSHDPTTLNRQGADVGTQYRSVIFYTTEEQKNISENNKSNFNSNETFVNRVVTEISPSSEFYIAEKNHQNYYNNNKLQPYCALIIKPKIDKIKRAFKNNTSKIK